MRIIIKPINPDLTREDGFMGLVTTSSISLRITLSLRVDNLSYLNEIYFYPPADHIRGIFNI